MMDRVDVEPHLQPTKDNIVCLIFNMVALILTPS